MATEIERKFLVQHDGWRTRGTPQWIRQGYLCAEPQRTVRIRLAGERAWLTVKGATSGIARSEFEYEIPAADAIVMLDELCHKPTLSKTRTRVTVGAHVWEVDEFFEDNAGLVVAEIELSRVDETFELPDFVGEEVTGDPRYFNSSLLDQPYARWRP